MSEPFAERLSRFTPDAGGLDRDALLFAAGRASVRPNRLWKTLAGALAASQVAMLVFVFWPVTFHQGADAPRSPVAPPSVAVQPIRDVDSWTVHPRVRDNPDDLPPPIASDSLVPDDPPLRASAIPPALIN